MKHHLLTTIAALVLVECGESQQSAPAPEAKPVEPVAEAAQPKTPTAKEPDILIFVAAGVDVNAKVFVGATALHNEFRVKVGETTAANKDVAAKQNVAESIIQQIRHDNADLLPDWKQRTIKSPSATVVKLAKQLEENYQRISPQNLALPMGILSSKITELEGRNAPGP
jgi:hypothetical protein